MANHTVIPGVCVVIRDGSKILVILRENTGWKDGEYAIPSGHVEAGETFRQAAVREVKEEVGLDIAQDELRHLVTVHRKSLDDRLDVYFEALSWSGSPSNVEKDKHKEIDWVEITDLPANMIDYMLAGLQAAAGSEPYGEFGWEIDRGERA